MFFKAIIVAIVAIVAFKVMQTVMKSGIHLHSYRHYPGDCRQVKGLEFGSEDLQVTSNGLAFITSGVWFPPLSTKYVEFLKINNIKGNIYIYDFNKPDLGAVKLKLTASKDFNPETFHAHGISLLEDEVKGEHLLYVINHREDSDDAIEKFRFLPKSNELVHLKSFTGDKLQITNDLAVTEEDKFYITNFMYFTNSVLSYLEQRSLIPVNLGSLMFFNGTDFTVVESGLHAPNGVFLSKDISDEYLYLNLPRIGSLNVYKVKDDNSLVKIQTVTLYTGADNLHLSQTGDALYTGTHPIRAKIIDHLRDPTNLSPSSVLRLPLKNGLIDDENITELFYDYGNLISGSSVAADYNSKLLIGSVINKLVICDVNIKL